MNAGELDIRIELQRHATTVSPASGARTTVFTTFMTVWAKRFEQTAGIEAVNADRRENKQTYIYTIRYTPSVTVRDRVKHGSDLFNIINIAQVKGRNNYLELQCELTQ